MTDALRDFRDSAGGQWIRQANNVAAALLVAAATAILIGLIDSGWSVPPSDPLLLISTRWVSGLFAAVALVLAWFCLLGKPSLLKGWLLLWLAANLAVYALGMQWGSEPEKFSAYLAPVATAFRLTPGTVTLLAALTVAGLAAAGLSTVLWFWLGGHLAESRKMACPGCGGHIEFAARNQGQRIPCPHCRTEITLRKPEHLKMSCHFCRGHIDFPAHALGTKMPCPHCRMDITLKEDNRPAPVLAPGAPG